MENQFLCIFSPNEKCPVKKNVNETIRRMVVFYRFQGGAACGDAVVVGGRERGLAGRSCGGGRRRRVRSSQIAIGTAIWPMHIY